MKFRNFRFLAEYIPIWIVDRILMAFPRSTALMVGEKLGGLMSFLFPSRSALMMKNLTLVFPEKSEKDKRDIVKDVWKNLGRVGAEFIRMSDINPSNFQSFGDLNDEDMIRSVEPENHGLILVSMHFSNWEMTGCFTHYLIRRVVAVARTIRNPYVQKWVHQKRGEGEVDIIHHKTAVRGCLKALKEKKAVGILVDQNLYKGGIFSDFLDMKAATTTLPALLHIRTGAPILILYGLRVNDRYRLFTEKPEFNGPIENSDACISHITQVLNDHLSRIIRKHPEAWFWVHNRWKRKPLSNESVSHP